jgi:hypothetical protein
MRLRALEPAFVTYVPQRLEPGQLYVSLEYSTAVHLCACGCGTKTVTPLAVNGWVLKFDGSVTLRPSIGNGQSPCRSHYLITRDAVDWLPPIDDSATRRALARDQEAAAVRTESQPPAWWSDLLVRLRRRT